MIKQCQRFGKVNAKKAPTASLMITAVLQTIFLFSLLFTDKAYEFAYSYVVQQFYSHTYLLDFQMKYSSAPPEWGQFTIGLLSAAFMFACMFLAGWQEVLLVSISFIPGFYIYYLACKENDRKVTTAEKWTMALILILSIIAIWLVANGTIAIS